jgi:carbonic anhydrase
MNDIDTVDRILIRLRQGPRKTPRPPAEQYPDVLYFGCIDARLDPLRDIGFKNSKVLIERQISALIGGLDEKGNPYNSAEAAAVQFAIGKGVKNIVFGLHTHCGGLGEFLFGEDTPQTHYIHEYMRPLARVRDEVLARHSDKNERIAAIEEGTARHNIERIKTYPFVRDAVERGDLRLHAWLLDTGTKDIAKILDIQTGKFLTTEETQMLAPRIEHTHRHRIDGGAPCCGNSLP